MDEMNKQDKPAGENGQGNEENIVIWQKPKTGKKVKYYKADMDETSGDSVQETEKQTKDQEEPHVNETDFRKMEGDTPGEGDALQENEQSKPEEDAEQNGDSFSDKVGDRHSPEKKKRKRSGISGKVGETGRRKNRPDMASENPLGKDNVSKKARTDFWKEHIIEGSARKRQSFMEHFRTFRRYLKWIAIIAAAITVIGTTVFYIDRNHRFRNMEVVWQTSASENVYSSYLSFNDMILHYSQDGVSCMDQNGNVVWNQAFNMDVPSISVRGQYAVIYDIKGNSLYICNKEGCTGSVETTKIILKADISENGVVAVMLDDQTSNYINYFKKDGSQLELEIKTLITGDGYPLDIAVSPDGNELMTSYIYAQEGTMMNQVVFRNFEVGKNNADRVVGGFRDYKETLVPEVMFFDNQNSAAVAENAVDFYSTRNASQPELVKRCELNSRIRSVLHNDKYIGVVLESNTAGDAAAESSSGETLAAADEGTAEAETMQEYRPAYRMLVFDKTGKQIIDRDIDFEYSCIDFSGDGIVAFNSTQVAVYNMTGVCKYEEKLNDIEVRSVLRFDEKTLVIQDAAALRKVKLK